MSARRRRRLLAVWLVLAVLMAAIATVEYRERRHRSADNGGAREASMLVPVPVDRLGAVEIAERGRRHRFERDAAGVWLYHGVHTAATTADHTHAADAVLSEHIERAFTAFGRARTERQFELQGDGAAYGLTAPEVVILLYRAGDQQPLAQYAVGNVAPDTVSRYVLLVGQRRVVTIPSFHVDNLREVIQTAAARSNAPVVGAR